MATPRPSYWVVFNARTGKIVGENSTKVLASKECRRLNKKSKTTDYVALPKWTKKPATNPKRVHKMRRATGTGKPVPVTKQRKLRRSVAKIDIEKEIDKLISAPYSLTKRERTRLKKLIAQSKAKKNPTFGKRAVSPKGFCIQAIAGTRTAIKYFYWKVGDRFDTDKSQAHKFGSRESALKMARSMLGKLPLKVRSLRVIEC
jgi:hypothetical protein